MVKLLIPKRWATQAVLLASGILMGAWALPSAGGQSPSASSSFTVSVKYTPAPPNVPPAAPIPPVILSSGLPVSVFCTHNNIPSAHGALVTVVCSTGAVVDIEPGNSGQPHAPMHGGSFRYVTHVAPNGGLTDTQDDAAGAGTYTSWRVVNSYLELTMGF